MNSSKTCEAPGCGDQVHILKAGLCRKHYNRQWRGKPLELPPKPSLEESFASRYKAGPPDACWIWEAGKDWDGYGVFTYGTTSERRSCRAPRLAWRLAFGKIPAALFVLHKCDNPSCVNPNHLFLGTAKDNSEDMMRKGRWRGRSSRKSRG
jgi:hypothetical protein